MYLTFYLLQAREDAAFRRLDDIIELLWAEGHLKGFVTKEQDIGQILMRFSTDGAKMAKSISSVRGVVKPLIPRDSLPKDVAEISMSPDDEYTLYLYMGKHCAQHTCIGM